MEYIYEVNAAAQPENWLCDEECNQICRNVLLCLKKFGRHRIIWMIAFCQCILFVPIFVTALGLGSSYPGVWHSVFTTICACSALFKRGWLYDIRQRRVAENAQAQILDLENQLMEEVELMANAEQQDAEPPNEGQGSNPEEIAGNQIDVHEQHVAECPGFQQGGYMTVVVNADVHHPQSYSPSATSKEGSSTGSPSASADFHDSGLPPALSHQQSSASTSNAATNWPAEEEESTQAAEILLESSRHS